MLNRAQRVNKVQDNTITALEEAMKGIGVKDFESTKTSLAGDIYFLTKKQKWIKMADREENGWERVR